MHKETGNALIGIIVITLVLVAGGIYFLQQTKAQLAKNEAARRALYDQTANVIDAVE